MVREWCYLKLLKRSGWGYDPLGARATEPGECAVLCPACPQPGKNLVPGWENAPEESRRVGTFLTITQHKFPVETQGCLEQ
jgi:hypothetical protein